MQQNLSIQTNNRSLKIYIKAFFWLSGLLLALVFDEGIKGAVSLNNPIDENYFRFSYFNVDGHLHGINIKGLVFSFLFLIGLLSFAIRYVFWSTWPILISLGFGNNNAPNNKKTIISSNIAVIIWSIVYMLVIFFVVYLAVLSFNIPLLMFTFLVLLPIVDVSVIFFKSLVIVIVAIIPILFLPISVSLLTVVNLLKIVLEHINEKSKFYVRLSNIYEKLKEKSKFKFNGLLSSFIKSGRSSWAFIKEFGVANLIDLLVPLSAFYLYIKVNTSHTVSFSIFQKIYYKALNDGVFCAVDIAKDDQSVLMQYLSIGILLASLIVFLLNGLKQRKYSKAIDLLSGLVKK